MRKQFLCKAAAAALALALLAGCGGGAASAGSSAPEGGASAPASSSAASAAAAPATAAEYQVLYNGVALGPGDDVAPVLAALGDGYEYSENVSCMFEDGMDKTYTYPDLTIYAYPVSADQDMILMIELTGDGVETSRGVKLGDDQPAALLAYNGVLTDDGSGSRYTAEMDGVLLTLTTRDGAVDAIVYELAETPAVG